MMEVLMGSLKDDIYQFFAKWEYLIRDIPNGTDIKHPNI